MSKGRFFICEHCGNLIGMIDDHGVAIECCGEKMRALEPNTTDAAGEKHVPVITLDGDTVTVSVGSVEHPMTQAHSICWIYLETEQGGQRKSLSSDDAPKAVFKLADGDRAVAAYAFCNLHGLWMSEL